MSKTSGILVGVLVVLALVIVVELLFFVRLNGFPNLVLRKPDSSSSNNKVALSNQEPTPSAEPLPLPAELTTNFNPSVNSAVFKVESVNTEKETLGLIVVWPNSWEGRRFESKITCADSDIKIKSYSSDNLTSVNKSEIFTKIKLYLQGSLGEPIFFFGLCSDNTCEEINRDCRFSLP